MLHGMLFLQRLSFSFAPLLALLLLGGCDTSSPALSQATPATQALNDEEIRKMFGSGIAPDGLVGRFSFSGDVRNTAPGERFRCREVVGAELTTDRFGTPDQAVLFEPGDHVGCGDVFNNVDLPYTVMLWARPTTVAGNQTLFISDFNKAGPYHGLRIKILDGQLDTFYGDGTSAGIGGRRGATSPVLIEAGEWVHLAAVVESHDVMRLYVNGKEVSASLSGYGGDIVHNSGPAVFGQGTTDAAIDDVYLLQGAVPADRIARIATDSLL